MKQENWETLEIQKPGWPIKSWTFKRCAGQNVVWALFGNDREGCTPWFDGRQWGFWEWWFRNMFCNFKWYVIGYAWWEEGNPHAAWNTDHLEYKFIKGDWESEGFKFILVKPRKRGRFYWRPYVEIPLLFGLKFWIGWKRRGQWACSLKGG